MQVQKEAEAKAGGQSPRSRQTSGTGSVSSVKSLPGGVSPVTKTAGDVKAGIVNGLQEGELAEGQEPTLSPNGNLRYAQV